MALDSQSQKLASESLENQGPQEAEIDLAGNRRDLRFEEVNDVTWKLTDGRGSIAWSGDRSGGYRTTRAVAWLMGIGNGLWVVRYRTKASRPMKLNAAKKYAIEMVRGVNHKDVKTDCSVNATIKGSTYCFSSQDAKTNFMKSPDANLKKTETFYKSEHKG